MMNRDVNPRFKQPREPKQPSIMLRRKTPLKRTGQLVRTAVLKVRRDTKHERWAKQVKQRDGYRCQFPGCGSSQNLEAQHINARSQRPDLRYDLGNGITLCRKHHQFVTRNPDAGTKLGLVRHDRYELARKRH